MPVSTYPAKFNVTNTNAEYGFIINGIAGAGTISAAVVGDVNGDGIGDIVIGGTNSSSVSLSYLVFGQKTILTNPLKLSNLNGENGVVMYGPSNSGTGTNEPSVASAGDINGDGIDDIIIGMWTVNNLAGQSYLVFGKKTGWTSPFALSSLNGNNGVIFNGIQSSDSSGGSVAAAGDINGDGVDDLVIGAMQDWNRLQGQSYLIFGKKTGWISPFALSTLNGANGVIFNGIVLNDLAGCAISSAGDINGDKIDDLLIGAYCASPNGRLCAGQSYIVFGKKTGWTSPFALSTLNGANGFMLNGITGQNVNAGTISDESGYSVASAGDVNGDGLSDILIGAPNASPNSHTQQGQSYVIFGKKTGWASAFELSNLNGANGVIFNGMAAGDFTGSEVYSAGDFNHDGLKDILIGAPSTNVGQAYLVFGRSNAWASPFALSSLNGANGIIFNGLGRRGASAVSAGDVNADGVDDILIMAPQGIDNITGYRTGGATGGIAIHVYTSQTYIIFGSQAFSISINPISIQQGQAIFLNSSFLTVNPVIDTIRFSVSGLQYGRFESINQSGIPLTTFSINQLLNNSIVFRHDGSQNPPKFSIAANNRLQSIASQSVPINFSLLPATITGSTTYSNASTPVPTTVQIITSSSPIFTTTAIVSSPQGNVTITTNAFNTTVTTTSHSVILTTNNLSTPTVSNTTSTPSISNSAPQSTNTTIPTSSGVITITSTTSGQVTVTVPPTMTITSTQSATSMPAAVATTTATVSSQISSSQASSPTSFASATSVILSNLTNATTPTPSVTTAQPSALANATGIQSNSGSNASLIAGVAGAAAGAAVAGAAFFLYRRRKQAQNRIQLAQQQKDKTEIFDIANPIHPTFKASEDPSPLLAESSTDGWLAHDNQGDSQWGDQYYPHHSAGTSQKQTIYDLAQDDPYASGSHIMQHSINMESSTDDWPAHYHTQNTSWGAGYYTHQSSAHKQRAVYDIANTEYVVPRASDAAYDLANSYDDVSAPYSDQKQQAVYDIANTEYVVPRASDAAYDLANSYDDVSASYSNQNQLAFFKAADKPSTWNPDLYPIQTAAWDKTRYQL